MSEFNFDPRVIDPDTYDMERAIVMRGVSLQVDRLRRKRETRAVQAQPPTVAPAAPAAKVGARGQGSTRRAAGEVAPKAVNAESLIRRWKSEPNLRAEFGCFARFAAYEQALAQGRARIGHPQHNRVQKPERVDRRWTGE